MICPACSGTGGRYHETECGCVVATGIADPDCNACEGQGYLEEFIPCDLCNGEGSL